MLIFSKFIQIKTVKSYLLSMFITYRRNIKTKYRFFPFVIIIIILLPDHNRSQILASFPFHKHRQMHSTKWKQRWMRNQRSNDFPESQFLVGGFGRHQRHNSENSDRLDLQSWHAGLVVDWPRFQDRISDLNQTRRSLHRLTRATILIWWRKFRPPICWDCYLSQTYL